MSNPVTRYLAAERFYKIVRDLERIVSEKAKKDLTARVYELPDPDDIIGHMRISDYEKPILETYIREAYHGMQKEEVATRKFKERTASTWRWVEPRIHAAHVVAGIAAGFTLKHYLPPEVVDLAIVAGGIIATTGSLTIQKWEEKYWHLTSFFARRSDPTIERKPKGSVFNIGAYNKETCKQLRNLRYE